MPRTWKNTSKVIKEHRLKMKLSQKQLSTVVIGDSKHGQFFWNIEAGKAGLPPKHLFKTSQVLMCPLQDLKNAMVQDYLDTLDAMIAEELAKV